MDSCVNLSRWEVLGFAVECYFLSLTCEYFFDVDRVVELRSIGFIKEIAKKTKNEKHANATDYHIGGVCHYSNTIYECFMCNVHDYTV